MDLGLKDKVVVLTGASKGMGVAAARAFAREGSRLVLAARNLEGLEEVASSIRSETEADITTCSCDITRDKDVADLMQAALDQYGRIDVLVNNGAGKIPAGDLLSFTSREWLEGWNQKIQAYVRGCQAVYPIMATQGGGQIINVLGTAARNPKYSYMAVGMSNAALVNFTKSLADMGAKDKIRAVGVAPSGVLTERYVRLIRARAEIEGKTAEELEEEMLRSFPMGRLAKPEELGDVICFVASERASYISGTVVTVDGTSTQGVYN
jgi:NAD(P)-dependent dehydrogenase (short-subunit alcohol dehydrogenase family)